MNLAEFYAERPDRLRSPEIDYGVHWTDDTGQRWPLWRLTYVEFTGEVVAVQQTGRIRDATVRVLGFAPSRDECDDMLEGWAEESHLPLTWARARLQPLPSGGA